MTAITVTKANVKPAAGSIVIRVTAGAAINLGAPMYLDGTNNWKQANAGATGTADARGVCVGVPGNATVCVSGDEVDMLVMGRMYGPSGMTPDGLVYASGTAGSLDDGTGTKTRVVGWAETATCLFVDIGHPADTT